MIPMKVDNNRIAIAPEGFGPSFLITIELNGDTRKHIGKLEVRNYNLTTAIRSGSEQVREANAVPIGVLGSDNVMVDPD